MVAIDGCELAVRLEYVFAQSMDRRLSALRAFSLRMRSMDQPHVKKFRSVLGRMPALVNELRSGLIVRNEFHSDGDVTRTRLPRLTRQRNGSKTGNAIPELLITAKSRAKKLEQFEVARDCDRRF